MKVTFIKRLDDMKSKTNQNKENQTYIKRKQNEFQNIYDISKEKKNQDLEAPEYTDVSPTKKLKKDDEYEISDLDDEEEVEVKKTDIDEDDPDYEHSENEEESDNEEFENPKPKKRSCNVSFPRATAAAIHYGISCRALCILIWAILIDLGITDERSYPSETYLENERSREGKKLEASHFKKHRGKVECVKADGKRCKKIQGYGPPYSYCRTFR